MGPETATERGRFWLKHHESQQASGKDAKAYAAGTGAGISVQALDPGRKPLREKGLRVPGRVKTTTVPRFSKVSLAAPMASPSIEEPHFQVTLPNGAVLEGSGAASVGPVSDRLERRARLP
jgi:hypothetical protein